MEISIKIKIEGREIELSLDEFEKLRSLFLNYDRPYIPQDFQPWDNPNKPYWDYTRITC